MVAAFHLAWMEMHNMLMGCSIALENLSRTAPPIDEDRKMGLLHTPFKGTTLFGGEVAKLQKANTEQAYALTVFPTSASPMTYNQPWLYVGQGRSYNYKKGLSQRRGGGAGDITDLLLLLPVLDLLKIARY